MISNMSSTIGAEAMKKQYYTGSYPDDAWTLQPYSLDDPKVLGLAYYKGSEYAMYMNPTDKRGYRSITRFINNADMKSTLNRDLSDNEHIGLSLVGALVENVYRKHVPIVQTFKAGNNSHGFDPEKRVVKIGLASEANFGHLHTVGIGDPEAAYIAGVPLDGPYPGVGFDMMGKTPHQPGNDKKVPWKVGEMEKVASVLKDEIKNSKKPFEELGVEVIIATSHSSI